MISIGQDREERKGISFLQTVMLRSAMQQAAVVQQRNHALQINSSPWIIRSFCFYNLYPFPGKGEITLITATFRIFSVFMVWHPINQFDFLRGLYFWCCRSDGKSMLELNNNDCTRAPDWLTTEIQCSHWQTSISDDTLVLTAIRQLIIKNRWIVFIIKSWENVPKFHTITFPSGYRYPFCQNIRYPR